MTIEERLEKLERELDKIMNSAEVRSYKFTLVDKNGKERGGLGFNENGPCLILYDENGKNRAVLSTPIIGSSGISLNLYGDGKSCAMLSADELGSAMVLVGKDGKTYAAFDIKLLGPQLIMNGPDGSEIWRAP